MAKVIFGQGIAGVKGKVGGSVFQRARSTYVMKQKGIPTNPKTSYQAGVRGKFSTVSKAWGLLTKNNRAEWNKQADSQTVAAKKKTFGVAQKLSGKALYQEVGQNLLLADKSLPTAPPAIGTTNKNEPDRVDVNLTDNTIKLEFDNATSGDAILVISATGTLSAGTTYVKGKFKMVSASSVAGGSTDVDITAKYIARFGALPKANDNVSFLVRQVTSGGYNDVTFEPPTQYTT